jgi:Domain of unknown function (DUF4397)
MKRRAFAIRERIDRGGIVIANVRRRIAALGVLGLLASLTACNGSATSINPFVPSRGTVRVINGSPDVGAIDVAIGKAGQPNFTNIVYAGTSTGSVGISQYIQFNAPTQNIYVYVAGQDSTPISVGMSSITIVPSGRNTLVLTGEKASGTLKLVNFTEHLFKTVSGSASVSFHPASPKAGNSAYSVGYYPTANTTQLTTIGSMTYGNNQPTFQEGVNAAIATTGIGFFARGGGNSLTLTPSQVDPNDTGNVMPFTFNGSANADQNLSIYMIDGATAARTPVLIGVFDPDN